MAAGGSNIRFSCKCGNRFEVPHDQAGGAVQCSRCGLLVDVPTFTDLEALEDDGTLKVAASPVKPEPNRLTTLTRVFARQKTDDEGNEIDLRTQPEDLLNVGVPTPQFEKADTFRTVAPRYDPVTGELLTPIEVDNSNVINHAEIPLARRQLNYVNAAESVASTAQVLLEMISRPGNIVAMFAIGVMMVILQYSALVSLIGFYFLLPMPAFLIMALIGHYANVVDDIGREAKDEIPRPIRSFSFIEDMWLPTRDVGVAFCICFGPALLVYSWAEGTPWALALACILAMVGTFLFPAFFLTKVCSGHFANLRPDRVVGVIRMCSWRYYRSVALLVLGAFLHYATFLGMMAQIALLFDTPQFLYYWMGRVPLAEYLMSPGTERLAFGLGYAFMALAIYAMHLFCWDLGLLARRHMERFPWAYQRHHSQPKPAPRRRQPAPMGQTASPHYNPPHANRPGAD